MDQYVVWAFILGGLSAISLLLGSLIGVSFKIPKSTTGLMAAFGAGDRTGSPHHQQFHARRCVRAFEVNSVQQRDGQVLGEGFSGVG